MCVHVYEINQTCLVFLNILRSDHVWCCLLCRMCACRLVVVCESQLGSRQLMRRQSKKRKWTECPRKHRVKSFFLWRTGSYSKKCLYNLPSKCNNLLCLPRDLIFWSKYKTASDVSFTENAISLRWAEWKKKKKNLRWWD